MSVQKSYNVVKEEMDSLKANLEELISKMDDQCDAGGPFDLEARGSCLIAIESIEKARKQLQRKEYAFLEL